MNNYDAIKRQWTVADMELYPHLLEWIMKMMVE